MVLKDFESYSRADLSKYSGKWIVVVNQKIVASGKDSKKLLEKIEKRYPKQTPMLAKVPKKILQVLSI